MQRMCPNLSVEVGHRDYGEAYDGDESRCKSCSDAPIEELRASLNHGQSKDT